MTMVETHNDYTVVLSIVDVYRKKKIKNQKSPSVNEYSFISILKINQRTVILNGKPLKIDLFYGHVLQIKKEGTPKESAQNYCKRLFTFHTSV